MLVRITACVALVLLFGACPAQAQFQPQLWADSMLCYQDSSRPGPAEVYAVTFRGSAYHGVFSSTVTVTGPGSYWTGLTANTLMTGPHALAAWRPGDLYVTALLERDGATNVSSLTLWL